MSLFPDTEINQESSGWLADFYLKEYTYDLTGQFDSRSNQK
jgi:hypothetical protein